MREYISNKITRSISRNQPSWNGNKWITQKWVKSNSHKDVQLGQESNEWKSENFNKEIENIKVPNRDHRAEE